MQNRITQLHHISLGLLLQPHIKALLRAHGIRLRFGPPVGARSGPIGIAVWGRRPSFRRGKWLAKRLGLPMVTLEDGFLRSVRTGRQGAQSLSLICDQTGVYFDTGHPNDLSAFALKSISPDAAEAAAALRDTLQFWNLSKYNDAPAEPPEDLPREFILVIDQTRNDASITYGQAKAEDFQIMLRRARADHPEALILIKTHPETLAGMRLGHFSRADLDARMQLYERAVSPWPLFTRARAVYSVTSQMGFEACIAGIRPQIFGRPFYAPNGAAPEPEEALRLLHHLAQDYTLWYDPVHKRASNALGAARLLAAQASFARLSQQPMIMGGMRRWKRRPLRKIFHQTPGLSFVYSPEQALKVARQTRSDALIWASKITPELRESAQAEGVRLLAMEDGFLRSQGLGAALTPPLSLAIDDLGIYYDPRQESRLERLIAAPCPLPKLERTRIEAVLARYRARQISKYNLTLTAEPLPQSARGRKVLLVPGQVEDDASILTATKAIGDNLSLLKQARADHPEHFVIYKPHPDVEAGLREGALPPETVALYADHIATQAPITPLIIAADRIATMTSLTGFEALIHGKEVACYGMPFYAGWGLTEDHMAKPARRSMPVSLAKLAHAALIQYPIYWDPVTEQICTIEHLLDRIEAHQLAPSGSRARRIVAATQRILLQKGLGFWR